MVKKIKFPFVLDVSSWKGKIDWEDVHPRPDLVICQASSGTREWDDAFQRHWSKLKRMHIRRGASHVFDPRYSGRAQIRNYLEAVEYVGGFDDDSLPPILDTGNLECFPRWTSGEKKVRQCLDEMESRTDKTPIIHVSRNCWNSLTDRKGHNPDWANKYLLWTPWYPSDPHMYKEPPTNTLPKGWAEWAIWKYDQAATVAGIKGYVSFNTVSEWYATQLGLPFENKTVRILNLKNFKIEATIIAAEGAIIRRHSRMNSKMLAFLAKGSKLLGESIEFVNANETWLQVYKPVIGWCPIVHTGRTYLSLTEKELT